MEDDFVNENEIIYKADLEDSEGGVDCSLVHGRQPAQAPNIRGLFPVCQSKLRVDLSVIMEAQFGHQQFFLLG